MIIAICVGGYNLHLDQKANAIHVLGCLSG